MPPGAWRRPQCSSRQCKSPPLNVSLLSECQWSASSLKDSGISIKPRFATIPSPVIRYLINDFGKIVGYLTLSPQGPRPRSKPNLVEFTVIKVKRHLPSAPFSESHSRQPSMTRSARLNKQRSGDFRLSPPANFANSAILPTDKISAFFMQNFLPPKKKPKDSSLLCPSVPTGEE